MNNMVPYLQIFKNSPSAYYTHTVLKGDELYEVDLFKDQKFRWRYIRKVNPKIYQAPGSIVSKPPLKTIYILQNVLQPKTNENEFIGFGEWIKLNEGKDRGYLVWKKQNVTLRGIKNPGEHNNVYGSFGKGLYTVPLSNKAMAKQYGAVYYLVNAKPKNPKVVQYLNDAEMLVQKLVSDFCKANGEEYSNSFFKDHTSIEKEMIKLGYDGLVIKGREMVNYTPDEDSIRYFQTEQQLMNYYDFFIAPQ